MFGILDVGFLGSVIALTLLAIREDIKLTFVGLLCAALTVGMYASPLSVMVSFTALFVDKFNCQN